MNRAGKGRSPLRRLAAMWLTVVLAAACGAATGAKPTGGRSADTSTPPPSSAPLADWQKLGATEVPPASLRDVPLQGVQVVDEAGAAVGAADARAWAGAYLRSLGYLEWAVSRGQDQFLLRSGLSSVPEVAFQPNFGDIAQARQAGVRVVYQRVTIRRLVVRAVPASLLPAFQGQRFDWKPYAVFLDAVGPAANVWVDAQGRQTVKSQLAPGTAAYELVGGELKSDPTMGDIWVTGSDWDCTAPNARQAMGALCNP